MKLRLLLLLVLIFLSGFSVAGADQTGCSRFEGFVWSRVSGRCVQEICPNDSIGRDESGDCMCASEKEPGYSDGKLIGCNESSAQMKETAVDPNLDENIDTEVGIPSSDVQAPVNSAKKETRSSSATPNTITIIVVVALGIGFWLYRLPPLKK